MAWHLREQIERGALKVGDKVPSERDIVERYGVSRATATKVLAPFGLTAWWSAATWATTHRCAPDSQA